MEMTRAMERFREVVMGWCGEGRGVVVEDDDDPLNLIAMRCNEANSDKAMRLRFLVMSQFGRKIIGRDQCTAIIRQVLFLWERSGKAPRLQSFKARTRNISTAVVIRLAALSHISLIRSQFRLS